MAERALVHAVTQTLNKVLEFEDQGRFQEAAEYQATMLVRIAEDFKVQQMVSPLRRLVLCQWFLPFAASGCGLCSCCPVQIPMSQMIAHRSESMHNARTSSGLSLDTNAVRLRSVSEFGPLAGKRAMDFGVLERGATVMRRLLVNGEATSTEQLEITSLVRVFETALVRVVALLGPSMALVVKNDQGNLYSTISSH